MFRQRKTILGKLSYVIIIPIIILYLVIFIVLGVHYRRAAIKDICTQIEYEANIIAQSVSARMKNVRTSANNAVIQLNDNLDEEDLNYGEGPTVTSDILQKIYQCMIKTFTEHNRADQVMIVWNNGVVWYENWKENYTMGDDGDDILQELKSLKISRRGQWIKEFMNTSQIRGGGPYYVKQYVDIMTQKPLGYIVIKQNDIFEIINNSDREIYLFNADGYLLEQTADGWKDDTAEKMKHEEYLEYSGELYQQLMSKLSDRKYYVHKINLERGDILISVSNMRQETRSLQHTIAFLMIFAVIMVTGMFLVLFRSIRKILLPMQKLSNHMVEMTGELLIPADIPVSDDEIGVLVRHFNKMTERNTKLVYSLMEEKKQQEYLKFQLLQAQIKPHFLYNSLDTIYCLSAMEQNEKAAQMTKALSDYYRHTLSNGMDCVFLYEEIRQTEDYLKIQQIRYEDRIDYEIEVDENVMNIPIPKLTFQPLVENAIYHGIKPLGQKGMLKLQARQKDGVIEIRITDNGVGMSKKAFQEAISNQHDIEDGFGLNNVVKRLQLYYADSCEVFLDETAGRGTCIAISIRMGNFQNDNL